MNVVYQIVREFFGLFVDDGSLALSSLALIGADGAAVKLVGLPPVIGGVLLIVGCLAILAMNVRRAARQK